jgi:uncharacterized radical SAM superfamily Fe-S cluster-containing enzyme
MEILKYADFEEREGKIENFAMINSLKLLSKDKIQEYFTTNKK